MASPTALWEHILRETATLQNETILRIVAANIRREEDLWACVARVLGNKLRDEYWPADSLVELIHGIVRFDAQIQEQITFDMNAYFDRDFACESYTEVLLFSRGFQAVTAYRIARNLLLRGERLVAKYFQNRIFEVFGIDIHPNAKLGKGIVVDHGIGLVVGETAEIGDGAFIFHNVTLGGTGHQGGDRHPKIKNHVFIGAGATLLGNITIHDHVNIAAGSVVTKDVGPNLTVAGVPAKVIGEAKRLQ